MNMWSIQDSTNSCQWDSDHTTETKSYRKNQYKVAYTIYAMINEKININTDELPWQCYIK
jgi:hypothetical protein